MMIALFFRKNQKKVFGKEFCLFLLLLLGEACRQTEHVTYLQSTAVQGNIGCLLNYGSNKDRKYNMKFGVLPALTSRKDLIIYFKPFPLQFFSKKSCKPMFSLVKILRNQLKKSCSCEHVISCSQEA